MIKKMLIGLAATLCLAGCNPGAVAPEASPAPSPAVAVAPGVVCQVTADAMFAAEAAYNVPAHAYVTADSTPALASRFASVKPRAKAFLVASYDALKKARLFYKTGDQAFCGAVTEAEAQANSAKAIIPK